MRSRILRHALCLTVVGLMVGLTLQSASAAEPRKVLLLGQKPDGHPKATHEYIAGQQLLAKLLTGVKGVEAKVIQADDPWTEGPELLKQADGVVLFVSEGARWIQSDPRRLDAFTQLAVRGGGLSTVHWGMGTKEAAPIEPFVKLFGGCHGGPDRKYQVLKGAEVRVAEHTVAQGIAPFKTDEEFYYRLKFAPGERPVTPLLQVPIDGVVETVAWAWDRPDGGRSFGFTGLHFHANWKKPEYRRLMLQGVLWSLKLEIPKEGVAIDLSDDAFELKP